MDTGKPGKPRAPRRDGRPGSGLLIRPHVGAETRVKSGGRAQHAAATDDAALSDASGVGRGDQTWDASHGPKR
jgi:hypothetical protein